MTYVDAKNLPHHVGIIMDGNGRWAEMRGEPREIGHKSGSAAVRRVVRVARRLGLSALTLYAFSEQNWARPPGEVDALMGLLEDFSRLRARRNLSNHIRLVAIGDLDRLPPFVRDVLDPLRDASGQNTKMTLALALSYGGQEEIARAARELAIDARAGRIDPSQIDTRVLASRLPSLGVPTILALIYVGPPWGWALFLAVALFVGALEFFGMTHPGDRISHAIGIAASLGLFAVLWWFGTDARVLVTMLFVFPTFALFATLARLGANETTGMRAFAMAFGPLWLGGGLVTLALVRRDAGDAGPGFVVLALVLSWFSDTGAYFAGRFLGKHKLYEAVSPKKTVEGAFRGSRCCGSRGRGGALLLRAVIAARSRHRAGDRRGRSRASWRPWRIDAEALVWRERLGRHRARSWWDPRSDRCSHRHVGVHVPLHVVVLASALTSAAPRHYAVRNARYFEKSGQSFRRLASCRSDVRCWGVTLARSGAEKN
ncbi:MAG: di-trans,poly-cis-decaprenylcistransferase [Polyangiaceae bacterium]|nr:di-trans,poly-cis-decaprenylcistransferase [Polyangiaceae bacterium]